MNIPIIYLYMYMLLSLRFVVLLMENNIVADSKIIKLESSKENLA